MDGLSHKRVEEILSKIKTKRIAVIGDLMVDKYVWGVVSRISPEAPVPIIEIENETARLGGAANVANNIKSLGGEPVLAGIIGNDSDGELLTSIVRSQGFPIYGVIIDDSRPTTVKTRVIAHDQHVVRIDKERKNDILPLIQQKLLTILEEKLGEIDGIIIEDYNKGVIVAPLIHKIIEMAIKAEKIITVDPKFNNFFEYQKVSLFKPNKKEVEEAIGRKIRTDEEVSAAGTLLLQKLNADNVLLTRGDKGMSLFERSGSQSHIPTRARHVADVSGAGDTVIATLTLAMTSGATVRESAVLANYAAGVVCGEVGIVPIDPEALLSSVTAQ